MTPSSSSSRAMMLEPRCEISSRKLSLTLYSVTFINLHLSQERYESVGYPQRQHLARYHDHVNRRVSSNNVTGEFKCFWHLRWKYKHRAMKEGFGRSSPQSDLGMHARTVCALSNNWASSMGFHPIETSQLDCEKKVILYNASDLLQGKCHCLSCKSAMGVRRSYM